MRRDYFTHEIEHVDTGDEQPTVHIDFEGPADVLDERLTPETDDIDVAFRYRTAVDEPDAEGVISVTDRMTGDFVLEVNATADEIADLVAAAREFGQSEADGCYAVGITHDGETLFETDKRTLLVYDRDGSLLRSHSLIPSGVEL